jgi:hypothetical protein
MDPMGFENLGFLQGKSQFNDSNNDSNDPSLMEPCLKMSVNSFEK